MFFVVNSVFKSQLVFVSGIPFGGSGNGGLRAALAGLGLVGWARVASALLDHCLLCISSRCCQGHFLLH